MEFSYKSVVIVAGDTGVRFQICKMLTCVGTVFSNNQGLDRGA